MCFEQKSLEFWELSFSTFLPAYYIYSFIELFKIIMIDLGLPDAANIIFLYYHIFSIQVGKFLNGKYAYKQIQFWYTINNSLAKNYNVIG